MVFPRLTFAMTSVPSSLISTPFTRFNEVREVVVCRDPINASLLSNALVLSFKLVSRSATKQLGKRLQTFLFDLGGS